MKRLFIFLPLIFSLTSVALCLEIEDCLDEFIFTELQVSAVTTDMYLYLGWFPDEKEWVKKASRQAIRDLGEIKEQIADLKLPQELIGLRDANLSVIEKLKEIYTGIEDKENEDVKQEFVSFNELYSQFQAKLKEALKKYRNIQELAENFEPLNEEVKGIKNEADRNAYLGAIELIKEKKYSAAYENLNKLENKYKDLAFKSCILLRMSDCLLRADSDLEITENKLEGKMSGLELLSTILSKKQYSSVLYEAFYKWRTTEQYYNHGMSNMSHIPNKEYNKKRWGIICVIKKRLEDVLDDLWAQEQIDLLLSLPNITRGGPMGNHNLEHWGRLYVDLSKFEDKE